MRRHASSPKGRGFASRAETIEWLDFHVVERLDHLALEAPLPAELKALQAQGFELRRRLESANVRVLRTVRGWIRSDRCRPEALKRTLLRCGGPPGATGSYDTLDLFVGGLLGGGASPEAQLEREPEMVFYQPTPARAILALTERAEIHAEDVFYDLGSGLGQVVILVALLTEARSIGIEFEPSYVEYSRDCARRLNVQRASFLQVDARAAPMGDGTVFFMYTPFRRALLQQVLERLRAISTDHPIRIATYGPCTAEVCDASWLTLDGGLHPGENEVAIFRSHPR